MRPFLRPKSDSLPIWDALGLSKWAALLEFRDLPFQKVARGRILTRWRTSPKGRCRATLDIPV